MRKIVDYTFQELDEKEKMKPEQEILKEKRFEFGKNWARFLKLLNDDRIAEAEKSIQQMLQIEDLKGKTFLDIGSGSGLFSLAAMRLGSSKILSFDIDTHSVACTQELKKRYFNNAQNWSVEKGSVLDVSYLSRLGQWDVVYSWGVLHHSGDMWTALRNIIPLVKKNGKIYIAIYNKQRLLTYIWTKIKKAYNTGNSIIKVSLLIIFISYFVVRGFFADLVQLHNPVLRYKGKKVQRGMSAFYDWIDWIGGYPFEAAKPEEIFDFYRKQGFILEKLVTCYGSSGNNEFVFLKINS